MKLSRICWDQIGKIYKYEKIKKEAYTLKDSQNLLSEPQKNSCLYSEKDPTQE